MVVVYVNYNQDQALVKSVESLLKYSPLRSLAVVIIDNSPVPSTRTRNNISSTCRKSRVDISYIFTRDNIGFGKACNYGSTIYKSKYLHFHNCDAEFIDASLENSIELIESSRLSVAALGCAHLDENLTPSFAAFPFAGDSLISYALSSNPILYRLFSIRKLYEIPSQPRIVGDISGAFILIKSAVFNQVGGFNPEFFLYSEDTSLCRDILVGAGYQILFNPGTRIMHRVGTPSTYSWRSKQALASELLRRYRQSFSRLLGYSVITYINYLILFFFCIAKLEFKAATKYFILSFDLLILLLLEMPVFLRSNDQLDFRVNHIFNSRPLEK